MNFTAREPPGLKIQTILKRLQPAKAASTGRFLRDYQRTCQGLNLIKKHFPSELVEYYTGSSNIFWCDVLNHFLNLVQRAGWFDIDFETMQFAYSYWMDSGEDTKSELVAIFLEHVPITLMGFEDQDSVLEYPPMELLQALLSCFHVHRIDMLSENVLEDACLYWLEDEPWTLEDQTRAWSLLHAIEADSDRYPEPVQHLPNLARWACCHPMQNVILDRHFELFEDGPFFRWDEHLEELKLAWRQAKPTVDALARLMRWYGVDNANLRKLASFIMKGTDCNVLDW